jgi:putative addiction module component (TIGR02574 family)
MSQMTPQASEVLDKALKLSTQEGGTVIARLIESMDDGIVDDGPSEDGAEAAWDDEIRRRVEQIDTGKVKMIPGEEVRRRLAARLQNAEK